MQGNFISETTKLKKFNAFIGLLVFSILDAKANEAALEILCDSPKILLEKIQFCSENSLAVESALDCQQRLHSQWKIANQELENTLSSSQKGSQTKQKQEINNSEKDLKKAIQKLDHLISMTKHNIKIIEKYPIVMLDSFGHQHVPCFLARKNQLIQVVKKLDAYVREGLSAKKTSTGLLKSASSENIAISSTTHQRTLASTNVEGKMSQSPVGFNQNNSGISEEIKNKSITKVKKNPQAPAH